MFVAPPWGDALDEETGLDLRRTRPPVPLRIYALDEPGQNHGLLLGTLGWKP